MSEPNTTHCKSKKLNTTTSKNHTLQTVKKNQKQTFNHISASTDT